MLHYAPEMKSTTKFLDVHYCRKKVVGVKWAFNVWTHFGFLGSETDLLRDKSLSSKTFLSQKLLGQKLRTNFLASWSPK